MANQDVKPLLASNRVTAAVFDDTTGILTMTIPNLVGATTEEEAIKEIFYILQESRTSRTAELKHPLVETSFIPNPPDATFTRGEQTTGQTELQTEVFPKFSLALEYQDPQNAPPVNDN